MECRDEAMPAGRAGCAGGAVASGEGGQLADEALGVAVGRDTGVGREGAVTEATQSGA